MSEIAKDYAPNGDETVTEVWLDALVAEQIDDATETPADYRDSGVDDGVDDEPEQDEDEDESGEYGESTADDEPDTDVEGDDFGPIEDDDAPPPPPKVFEPLPEGAGVLPQGRSVRMPGGRWITIPGPPERTTAVEPEPDEFQLKVREYLASLPAKGAQT